MARATRPVPEASIEATDHTVDLLDLKEFDFSGSRKRLKFMKDPTSASSIRGTLAGKRMV
ncbi:MAG: hypothetical protein IPH60_10845 [Flavobacteriales bacterium]|nr:hypothetical protein [Flavobacteriales bacterium]